MSRGQRLSRETEDHQQRPASGALVRQQPAREAVPASKRISAPVHRSCSLLPFNPPPRQCSVPEEGAAAGGSSPDFCSGRKRGSSKVEEACEIYARAANMFKMAKNWSAAGNAFCQAAQLHLQLQSKHDAATCFVDAGNAFKKADPQEAINCLMRAIEIYTDMVRVAARPSIPLLVHLTAPASPPLFQHQKQAGRGVGARGVWSLSWAWLAGSSPSSPPAWFLAAVPAHPRGFRRPTDTWLQPCGNTAPSCSGPRSLVWRLPIPRTGPWPPALRVPHRPHPGHRPSSSSSCSPVLVVTWPSGCPTQAHTAASTCPQVGTTAMDSPLLKYSAKDYFFKAALCHFCIDMLNAKLAVQKYEELFPAFSDSRECKLMKKLLEAHEEQNVDGYTEAVKEYDSISRLDQWLTTMLLRVKKTIQGDEEDLR
nr:PREDICTED: alpha-soluble NSF attachment protein [Equus przewalskii]